MQVRGARRRVRFATFNTALFREDAGQLADDLAAGGDKQAQTVAAIIQQLRPDVLLVNEFDYDETGRAIAAFQENYLAVGQEGAEAIRYPYHFCAPSNTGIDSGFDLDGDGALGGPGDAFGYGLFPGQYGMVVFSMYPIDRAGTRTFQRFLWRDMPGALLPDRHTVQRKGDAAAVVEESLGCADHDWGEAGPLPGQPPHAAGREWGAQ